jgi:hypothetical protein
VPSHRRIENCFVIMPKYRATVHVSGLAGDNPRAVRSALDAQLRQIGLEHWRVVALDVDAPPRVVSPSAPPIAREPDRDRPVDAGALLLVGAAAWAIWFFWLLFGS